MSLMLLFRDYKVGGRPGGALPTPNELVTGGVYPMVHIGTKDGLPLLFPFRAIRTGCGTGNPTIGDIYAVVQVGMKQSTNTPSVGSVGPVFAPLVNACDVLQGDFTVSGGQTWAMPGIQIGVRDGKPLFAAWCERCLNIVSGDCLDDCNNGAPGTRAYMDVEDPGKQPVPNAPVTLIGQCPGYSGLWTGSDGVTRYGYCTCLIGDFWAGQWTLIVSGLPQMYAFPTSVDPFLIEFTDTNGYTWTITD